MNKSTQTTDQITTDQRLTHIEDKLEAMTALLVKLNDNIEKRNESSEKTFCKTTQCSSPVHRSPR